MSVEVTFNNNCKAFYREEICKILEKDFFDDQVLPKFNITAESEESINDRYFYLFN